MKWIRPENVIRLLPVAVVCLPLTAVTLNAAEVSSQQQFQKIHAMIKTQPGELRYRQIPWLTSVWQARQKAATDGKPIFIWAGSGGGLVGVC